MKEIELYDRAYRYNTKQIAGMTYLCDERNKLQIVVSNSKAELKPFRGSIIELYFTKDCLAIDLCKRAKLYAKVCACSPSLKSKTMIRRHIVELMVAHLHEQRKRKERPRYVSLVEFLEDSVQINTTPVDKLYTDGKPT